MTTTREALELEAANERVMAKATALVNERDGLAATVRVHEFTIRQVSTDRDALRASLASERAGSERLRGALERIAWHTTGSDGLIGAVMLARAALAAPAPDTGIPTPGKGTR